MSVVLMAVCFRFTSFHTKLAPNLKLTMLLSFLLAVAIELNSTIHDFLYKGQLWIFLALLHLVIASLP